MIEITPNDKRWYELEDLPEEEWRDIKDFEGLYQVSNYGRVKRLERKIKSHILYHDTNTLYTKICKPTLTKNKYYKNVLTKNNKKYNKQVHRLVAEAFIPNPNNLPQVNHKIPVTENICDNRVHNLEWCTKSYNTQYMIKLGRNKNGSENRIYPIRGEHHNAKIILKLDLQNNIIHEYKCVKDFINDMVCSVSKCYEILNNNLVYDNYKYIYDDRR